MSAVHCAHCAMLPMCSLGTFIARYVIATLPTPCHHVWIQCIVECVCFFFGKWSWIYGSYYLFVEYIGSESSLLSKSFPGKKAVQILFRRLGFRAKYKSRAEPPYRVVLLYFLIKIPDDWTGFELNEKRNNHTDTDTLNWKISL